MPDFLSSLARTSGSADKEIGLGSATKNSGDRTETPKNFEFGAKKNTAGKLVLSKAQLAAIFKFFRDSGLFDACYYTTTYPDIARARVDPLEHFYFHGYLEGRQPNLI